MSIPDITVHPKGDDSDWDEPKTRLVRAKRGFRPTPARAHVLSQVDGPGGASQIVRDRDLVTLGRATSNDIKLDNGGVSRNHARLIRTDDEYTLEDNDSRNGIYLNGLQVHSAVLRDGDEVQIGDFVFHYQEG